MNATERLVIRLRETELELEPNTVVSLWWASEVLELARAVVESVKTLAMPLPTVVGFVGEEFPLLANLSVYENALLPVIYHGIMSKTEAQQRFDYLSDRIGFSNSLKHARKYELNTKEHFMAQLLRAMMPRPGWIVVDFGEAVSRAFEFVAEYKGLLQEEGTGTVLCLVRPSRIPQDFKEVRLNG